MNYTKACLELVPRVAEIMGLGLEIEGKFMWRNFVSTIIDLTDVTLSALMRNMP